MRILVLFKSMLVGCVVAGVSAHALDVDLMYQQSLDGKRNLNLLSEQKGKVINGFSFDTCSYHGGRINYCSEKSAANIIKAAVNSKSKPILGKYRAIVVVSKDGLTKSPVMVDIKSKKVYTSNVEFGTEVKTDVSDDTILIYGNSVKGWVYPEMEAMSGSRDNPVELKFYEPDQYSNEYQFSFY